MRRYGTTTVSALLLLLAASCVGGGGESDILGNGGNTGLAASFQAEQASPGNNTISASEGTRSGDLVTVMINVTGTDDIFGAEFVVTFDPARVEFVAWSPGNLLETGGSSVIYAVTQTLAGRLEVGASRQGGFGTDVTGTQTLIELTFRTIQAGASALDFESQDLLDDGPELPQPIPGLSWFGGAMLAG